MSNPFRYFNSSPEIIRLAVMMYVKYSLSLRNVEDGSVMSGRRPLIKDFFAALR
jgi:transposase-like protein